MAGVNLDRRIDHRIVGAKLPGEHKDEKYGGKDDRENGENRPPRITPYVSPYHLDLDRQKAYLLGFFSEEIVKRSSGRLSLKTISP